MKCLLIQPQSGASQTLRRARQAALIKKFDKARQNRTFAKRNLEQGDCLARSAAQAERGGFPRKRRAVLSRNSPRKKGKTAAERVGFSPQASEKRKGRRGLCRTCPFPFCFSLKSSAAKSHFASVTSKMRRAHFPNECDLSHERGRKE